MWIMDGKKNCTLIGCWSGCEKSDILAAVGLKFSDLFEDSKPNEKALREVRRLQAEETRKRRQAKERLWRMEADCDDQRKLVLAIGKELSLDWGNRRLSERFHYALERYRKLDRSVVNQLHQIYGIKREYFVVGDL